MSLKKAKYCEYRSSHCCRYNKLALDMQQASEEETAVKNEVELPHPPLTGDQETDKESNDKEGGAPAILSLIKDPPNLMNSSFILSSFHARKMARNGTGDQHQAQEQHGSVALQSRATRVQQRGGRGVVDEVCVFRPSGSSLLNSKRITAASTGTNHTVFKTGTQIACVVIVIPAQLALLSLEVNIFLTL